MAGQLLGAQAPTNPVVPLVPQSDAIRVGGSSSRTRRNHGVFMLGDELATVYSSRRAADALGVSMAVGTGSLVLTGSMTPRQARAMAGALMAAATAAEVLGVQS